MLGWPTGHHFYVARMHTGSPTRRTIEQVAADVRLLRDELLDAQTQRADAIAACHPRHRRSAANLMHYVALREHDLRSLQAELTELGLSSLGRAESSVLGTVEAVLDLLCRLIGGEPAPRCAEIAVHEGAALLAENAVRLLGPLPAGRSTRIMVTLPSEAADDTAVVSGLRRAGMDLARVNCAHDDLYAWSRMVASVRSPLAGNDRPCLVAIDLAGPKLRTGPMEMIPGVLRVRPTQDDRGRVVEPRRVFITASASGVVGAACGVDAPDTSNTPMIPVRDADWVGRRVVGERISIHDARGATRTLTVVDIAADGCVVECRKSTSFIDGTVLAAGQSFRDATEVSGLPPVEKPHRVATGDTVVLTRSLSPATATGVGGEHRIGCTLPEVFSCALPGERLFLDDGKIGARIESVTSDEVIAVVTDAKPGGANLRGAKGINLPDTTLNLAALTNKDLADLDFVAEAADLVDFSFVRRPADIEHLQHELAARGAERVGVVLKIENVAAFECLPELLLTGMRSERVGVMIARGDLAVEVGFERLAEVQEEILWICEAAHVPVVWATEVLDTMARTGRASRAEVTDAAMGERAECVMLNKGPHILHAIATLDSIAARMQHHQSKKRSLLRRLNAWGHSLSR